PRVQKLGKLTLIVRVIKDIVEVRLLLVLHLVEMINKVLLLLLAILLQFPEGIDAATNRFILNSLDQDVGQFALHRILDQFQEIMRIREKLIQTSTADEDINDGLTGQRGCFLQLINNIGQLVTTAEVS